MSSERVKIKVREYNDLVQASYVLDRYHTENRRIYIKEIEKINNSVGWKFWKRISDSGEWGFNYEAFSFEQALSLGIDISLLKSVRYVETFVLVPDEYEYSKVDISVQRLKNLHKYLGIVNKFSLE